MSGRPPEDGAADWPEVRLEIDRTLGELERIDAEMDVVRRSSERLDRRLQLVEHDLAAADEAEQCGCPLFVDVDGVTGEDVTGSARVAHHCGL